MSLRSGSLLGEIGLNELDVNRVGDEVDIFLIWFL